MKLKLTRKQAVAVLEALRFHAEFTRDEAERIANMGERVDARDMRQYAAMLDRVAEAVSIQIHGI